MAFSSPFQGFIVDLSSPHLVACGVLRRHHTLKESSYCSESYFGDEAESQAHKLSQEVAMLKANQTEMVANQEEMNKRNKQTQALVR